jgi:WD40 repeat protein
VVDTLADGEGNALAIPGYRICERIGIGGFGEVFRARQDVIDRDVAIKVLHPKYSSDPESVARFVAEARAVGRLSHPGIVDVIEHGTLPDGRQFLVMELVRGSTLREVIREHGRLPLAKALPILRGIADAVDAAHGAGIAHRDLKPDNVFVLDGGGVKLIDFGLAKLSHDDPDTPPVTRTGVAFGTPLYMSPEQCRGKNVTLATDAYSFGVLAYQLLVGELPFTGEPLELALKHLHDDPPRPSAGQRELGRRVDETLLALLAKDPAARPRELRDAVESLAGGKRVARRWRRWPIAAAVCVAAVAAVVLLRPRADATTYRDRIVRVRFDGLAILAGLDGTKLLYNDASGWWQYDFASGALTKPIIGNVGAFVRLRDGRLVVADRNDDGIVALEDPNTHARRQLHQLSERLNILGGLALSPDGRSIAFVDGDWLMLIDVATLEAHRLANVKSKAPSSSPRWSPDGRRLLLDARFGGVATNRLHLVDVATGEMSPLAVPLLSEPTWSTVQPADFMGNGHVVYCADGKPAGSLRIRDLSTGRDRTLATLEAGVSLCSVVVAGQRIAVMQVRHRPNLGVIDLAAPVPEVRLVAGDSNTRTVLALSHDGEHAFVEDSGALVRISTTTGEVEMQTSCSAGVGVVRRGIEMLRYDYDEDATATTIRLRDRVDCKLLDEWTLPAGAKTSPTQCGTRVCAVAGTLDGEAVAWRLAPGAAAQEIWRGGPSPNLPVATVAVSPDDRHIVVGICGPMKRRPDAIAIDGSITSVPFEAACGGFTWGPDPDRFLVVTHGNTFGGTFALASVALDGSARVAWTSDTMSISWPRAAPGSTRVAMTTRAHLQELHVIELR